MPPKSKTLSQHSVVNHQRWMTVEETAQYLGLSKATIYQYVCERRIPYVKIPKSNQVRFDRELIDMWMESGRMETIAEVLFNEGDK